MWLVLKPLLLLGLLWLLFGLLLLLLLLQVGLRELGAKLVQLVLVQEPSSAKIVAQIQIQAFEVVPPDSLVVLKGRYHVVVVVVVVVDQGLVVVGPVHRSGLLGVEGEVGLFVREREQGVQIKEVGCLGLLSRAAVVVKRSKGGKIGDGRGLSGGWFQIDDIVHVHVTIVVVGGRGRGRGGGRGSVGDNVLASVVVMTTFLVVDRLVARHLLFRLDVLVGAGSGSAMDGRPHPPVQEVLGDTAKETRW